MDLFDVFLEYNADFNLSVRHDGENVHIVFALANTKEVLPPVVVKVIKGNDYSSEEIRTAIKNELANLQVHVAPIAEQVATLAKAIADAKPAEKPASKPAKADKPKEKVQEFKDDTDMLMLISTAETAMKNPLATKDSLDAVLVKMRELNASKSEVRPATQGRFDEVYKKLNTQVDAFQESLF